MKNRTKKWLLVSGCLLVCAAMVGLIGNSFVRSPVWDDQVPTVNIMTGGVTVDSDAEPEGTGIKDDAPPIIVKMDMAVPVESNAGSGAVFTGAEQIIQPDATKSVYSEEVLTNPAKTPGGVPVAETPQPAVNDPAAKPPAQEIGVNNSDSEGIKGNNPGGLPGFGNVPQGGENNVVNADDMYENGNKIGIMG